MTCGFVLSLAPARNITVTAAPSRHEVLAGVADLLEQKLQDLDVDALGGRHLVLCRPGDPVDETCAVAVRMPLANGEQRFCDFLMATMMMVGLMEDDGAVLMHAALCVRDGKGVLLAASGGTGKSTASRRLPPPWHSPSDDAALILPDSSAGFRVHPWPTLSRHLDGGPGGSWDVTQSYPLAAIFFLRQSHQEVAEPLSRTRAVAELAEAIEQLAAWPDRRCRPPQAKRPRRLHRFDAACAIGRAVPAFSLELSLTGKFWTVLDQALGLVVAAIRNATPPPSGPERRDVYTQDKAQDDVFGRRLGLHD